MNKYYDILDLPETATVDDIRKAYRSKAKQFHPDRNKTPGAQQKFVEVNEAYEYLINLKEGKITSSGDSQIDDFAKWWRREEARIREEAHRKSQMRYKKYVKTEDDLMSDAIDEVAGIAIIIASLIIVVAAPIALTIWKGWTGFWISLVLVFVTSPFTSSSISYIKTVNFKRVFKNLKDIVTAKWFKAGIITIINIVCFFNVGFKTLIPVTNLLFCYLVVIGITLSASIVLKFGINRHNYFSFVLAPAVITVLLLVNFWVSFNPVSESYYYSLNRAIHTTDGRTYYETSSLMQLENNVYEEYFGLRFFIDINEVNRANHVTFTFKKGILGFRVLKEYKLEMDLTHSSR